MIRRRKERGEGGEERRSKGTGRWRLVAVASSMLLFSKYMYYFGYE